MRVFFILMILCQTLYLSGHTISGNLSSLSNQVIYLKGFNGFNSYPISNASISENGDFSLTYSKINYGVGYLVSEDEQPFLVILNGEDIEISGESLTLSETVRIKKGIENQLFEKYARELPRREQALSAWIYLERMYTSDSIFAAYKEPNRAIKSEKSRLLLQDSLFLSQLPNESFVRWFIPVRKLVSSVSVVAQFRPEEISATIEALRKIDYSDQRLYKSGLLKDAIESHFWLVENSGKQLDSVFQEMKVSIDAIYETLLNDDVKLNEITDFLFNLLEQHSLSEAAEYLALKLLNETSCVINADLSKQLETYRSMKKGNIAPDIVFSGEVHRPIAEGFSEIEKLSEFKSKYTFVVFAASWCPSCNQSIPQISTKYSLWKQHGVEVLLVSLDESQESFSGFVENLPFISICDFKKWDSPIVNDYYVFGTPTTFLLDENRKILLRPTSVNQMDAWVDWFLIKGNQQPN